MQKSNSPAYFNHLNSLGNGVTVYGRFSEEEKSTFIVTVHGFLDNANSKNFMESVLSVLRERENQFSIVVLDLGGLTYLSSTGVGTFNNIMLDLQKRNKKFYLANVGVKIESVLKLLGLYSFFEKYNKEIL